LVKLFSHQNKFFALAIAKVFEQSRHPCLPTNKSENSVIYHFINIMAETNGIVKKEGYSLEIRQQAKQGKAVGFKQYYGNFL
jgi:hypothetical protein